MKKVLIVDDEPFILEGLQHSLTDKGFDVTTAENGENALSLLSQSYHPDLVITDIIMPEKDGIEVIWSLKEKYPDVRIIAISGGGRISATDHLKIAKKLGADAILTKPFSTDELMETIETLNL